MDVLCQAKSGMGKTAVFVLATLQQLEPVIGQVCLGKVLEEAFWFAVFGKGVCVSSMMHSEPPVLVAKVTSHS